MVGTALMILGLLINISCVVIGLVGVVVGVILVTVTAYTSGLNEVIG